MSVRFFAARELLDRGRRESWGIGNGIWPFKKRTWPSRLMERQAARLSEIVEVLSMTEGIFRTRSFALEGGTSGNDVVAEAFSDGGREDLYSMPGGRKLGVKVVIAVVGAGRKFVSESRLHMWAT